MVANTLDDRDAGKNMQLRHVFSHLRLQPLPKTRKMATSLKEATTRNPNKIPAMDLLFNTEIRQYGSREREYIQIFTFWSG